jgi:hypothetical protein
MVGVQYRTKVYCPIPYRRETHQCLKRLDKAFDTADDEAQADVSTVRGKQIPRGHRHDVSKEVGNGEGTICLLL